jgi:hypothetical protein
MLIYFAWVDGSETTFGPEHERQDEHVASLDIVQEEGAFATATVVIKNPRIGFLHVSRKQWCWISDEDGALFFGRLTAIPTDINKEAVTVEFEARPADFQDQKEALASDLRTLPTYDPVWLTLEAQADPDTVLEARPEMWHIDRVTGEVTTSHILVGEDGLEEFQESEIPFDSVEINLAQVPARTLRVTGTVTWKQGYVGTINCGQFTINTFTGKSLLDGWPKAGASIGGGWNVAEAAIRDNWNIDDTDTSSTTVSWSNEASQHANGDTLSMSISATRPKLQGGTPIELPLTLHTKSGESEASTESTSLLVPEWSLTGNLVLGYTASRDRRESIVFSISANFQPIVTLPGEEDVQLLDVQGGDVGIATQIPGLEYGDTEVPIGDARFRSYFTTERGLRSLEWLLLRARSQLMLGGRCVEVTADIPYARARELSCRMNGKIHDHRLPGGVAQGKIVKYDLRADGSSGTRIGSVTVAASVGYGGTVAAVAGEPDYVDADYVEDDYQVFVGSTEVLDDNIGYSPPVFVSTVDDGLSFPLTSTDIKECALIGDLDLQRAFILSLATVPTTFGLGGPALEELLDQIANRAQTVPKQLDDGLSQIAHYLSLRLPNLDAGPFDNVYSVDVTMLELPKGIDLEAAAS